MEDKKEITSSEYPNLVSYDCSKKILEQMEKNVCKIKMGNNLATGFFCKIPFPNKDKLLPFLITNNYVLNDDLLHKNNAIISLNIKNEEEIKEFNLNN